MKKNYQRIITVTALVLLATSTMLRASETDERIVASFQESYVFKTYLKDDAVQAESNKGVVTLSGTVNQQSHKGLAAETAANLPGVKSVDNRLELKAKYPTEKSDEWIAMNIKAALFFHRNVNAKNTQIYVQEGIVTLRGEVDNEAQKELTAEYADLEGVRKIKNEMTVSKTPSNSAGTRSSDLSPATQSADPAPRNPDQTMKEQIDDASITAQVKMALLTHRSTSVIKTSVATNDGVVTLGGTAQNDAEKELVTKLVGDIFGVKSIINDMSISVHKNN